VTSQQTTDDREAPRHVEVDLGHEAPQASTVEHLGVDAGETHGVAATRVGGHLVVGDREIDDAARAVHDVVV
jgi:hypothetical protein